MRKFGVRSDPKYPQFVNNGYAATKTQGTHVWLQTQKYVN